MSKLWAMCGFVPRFEALGTPSVGKGYATTCDFVRLFEVLGNPGRQGLCSHLAPLWATSNPPHLPAVKRWGPPTEQGLHSHVAHLWAYRILSLAVKRLELPARQRLCSHPAHLCATCGFVPVFGVLGTP